MKDEKINEYFRLLQDSRLHSLNPIVENALNAQRRMDVARAGSYELVVNEPDTSDANSPAGSWRAYWMKNGNASGLDINSWPSRCSVCGCHRPAEHGAHVRSSDGRVYIVPMCAAENNPHNTSPMLLRQDVPMVLAPERSRK